MRPHPGPISRRPLDGPVFSTARSGPFQRLLLALGAPLVVAALLLAAPPASAREPSPGVSPAAGEALTQARLEALQRAQAAVVRVRTIAVDDAQTLDSLGPRREGSGVVIDRDGLVLTIGYLLLEAETVDLELGADRVVPARVVGIDTATGFGLLQPLVPLRVAPVPLGQSGTLAPDQALVSFSGGRDGGAAIARMVSQRPYSGTWEYHIDKALYTAPLRSDHSGAALFNVDGELVGIGSLVLRDVNPPDDPAVQPGNLFVPVDLLKPILAQLKTQGRVESHRRPWLGVNATEAEGQVRVLRVNREGPAFDAGIRPGDRIEAVDGEPVRTLEQFYKSLWKSADPERTVKLAIRRGGVTQTLDVQAVDRQSVLRRAKGV